MDLSLAIAWPVTLFSRQFSKPAALRTVTDVARMQWTEYVQDQLFYSFLVGDSQACASPWVHYKTILYLLNGKSLHCGFSVSAKSHHIVELFLPSTSQGKPQDNGDFPARPSLQIDSRLRCHWLLRDDFSSLSRFRRSTSASCCCCFELKVTWFHHELVFTASLSEVENGLKPCRIYKAFRSIQTRLICCMRAPWSSPEIGHFWFVKEINLCRARSFSDASRASFAGLNTLPRIMENGLLWGEPDKNLSSPERIASIVLRLYGFASTFTAST